MKNLTIAIITAGVLGLALPALAQEEEDEHAGHHPPPASQENALASPAENGFERMRSLIAQAQAAQDPAVRSQLLAEHLQLMREQVRAMRVPPTPAGDGGHDHSAAAAVTQTAASEGAGKKGGMMDKCGMMDKGGMMGKGEMKKKGGMMGMHKRVEQRLDAIEQMLEQLVEREALEP